MREKEDVQRKGGTCIISDKSQAQSERARLHVGTKCLAESAANGKRTTSAKC